MCKSFRQASELQPIDVRDFTDCTHLRKIVRGAEDWQVATLEVEEWLERYGHLRVLSGKDKQVKLFYAGAEYHISTWRKLNFAKSDIPTTKHPHRRPVELTERQWSELQVIAAVTGSRAKAGPRTGQFSWRALIRRIAHEATIEVGPEEVVIRLAR